MSEYFEENKRAFTLLATLLFILAVVLFFVLLRPLLVEVKSKEQQIDERQEKIAQLEQQIETLTTEKSTVDAEEMMLQNKIPEEKELDSYITWLEKLESLTDTKLERIQFVYDSEVEMSEAEEAEDDEAFEEAETDEDELDEIDDELEEEEANEDDEESEEDNDVVIDEELINERPDGLEVIVVNITGHAKKYGDLIDLLEAIEAEERISFVSRINFSQPTADDITFSDNPNIALSFTIDLTTFYYPN